MSLLSLKIPALRGVPILMYHGVVADDCGWAQWTQIPLRQFTEHMEFLAANYNVISLREFLRDYETGSLSPNTAVITFDDGFRNVYTRAFPILQRLGLPATIFVTTGFIGTQNILWPDELFCLMQQVNAGSLDLPDLQLRESWKDVESREPVYLRLLSLLKELNIDQKSQVVALIREQLNVTASTDVSFTEFQACEWNQLREMKASGLIDIGAHTVSHEILSRLDDTTLNREIEDSCSTVMSELEDICPVFAYPNGQPADFDKRVIKPLEQQNIRAALTTIDGLSRATDDPFSIRRVPIGNETNLESALHQYIKWCGIPFQLRQTARSLFVSG